MAQLGLHIGRRLRLLRERSSLTPAAVAERLGSSVEAYLAYEQGADRVPSAQLIGLAKLFDVSIAYFFVDYVGDDVESAAAPTSDDITELIEAFKSIDSGDTRRMLLDLLRDIAAAQPRLL